jgi:carbamoyl-phosphate synthase large subunit
MPKRSDIKSILIIGAGPIVIGQACEFDYSGVQACRALKQEGYRIILINSNPATIMTDPDMADATYIEPVTWEVVAKIIEQERPDALLPTMGGQTALNCALDLAREGILEKYHVELIGASRDAIDKAEDRERFRKAMIAIGLEVARSLIAHSMEEALQVQVQFGFPCIIRPSFTLGGSGGGIAYNREEFIEICERGLALSPTHELLIEESVIGWKEYEMEVVRDCEDNCIIVCSIENFDAMGVHTGDSITVAPAQTLTDKEYQRLRDASIAVLREIGVDTGGSNVQFAVNPKDGRLFVIEMNPRVSRSSALASKVTGFPIAKVAAKLAVGYTLNELRNEITGNVIPASFEPTIDYVVTKIPRFNFEKFPQTEPRLTTQMKSVGEVMAIGRTFQQSLQKALRSLEINCDGLDPFLDLTKEEDAADVLRRELRIPGAERIRYIADAFRFGFSLEEIAEYSGVDPWFLAQIEDLLQWENKITDTGFSILNRDILLQLKKKGFSDRRLAKLLKVTEEDVRELRYSLNVHPVYKRVDSCAGEFSSNTAYMYSCYEPFCESRPSSHKKKIVVLGSGPNRIGQGIEFDYCCVHAALAIGEQGYETIMVNCNPETVSTDYDISDRLYFEPLTLEDVLEIVRVEQPQGVIVQYGGQTPLKLARALEKANVTIIGTSSDAIDRAEDRERFQALIQRLQLCQPPNGIARNIAEGLQIAKTLEYPLIVRPSYVLGGRAMEIVYNDDELQDYLQIAVQVSDNAPVLLDRFLDDAVEVDVDAVCDGKHVFIAGIMEHIEQAGVHSGDSACCLPPFSLSDDIQVELDRQMRMLALELGVVGLMNAQFAIQANKIYILEVNPRASRTVPFVSKVTGIPLAKVAAKCMVGIDLVQQGLINGVKIDYFAVKMPVFPFSKFLGVDPILGPEMKSTGEVMGVGDSFGEAYGKAHLGAGKNMPSSGRAFVSVRDPDKVHVVEVANNLLKQGFEILATNGTERVLKQANVPCKRVNKVREGRPHIVDMIKNNEIRFIVNTTEGKQAIADSYTIRRNALQHKVCYTTTISGAKAALLAMEYGVSDNVKKLQQLH